MARLIFEYDAATGMISDSSGLSMFVGKGRVPYEPKPMDWLGKEPPPFAATLVRSMREKVPMLGPEVEPPVKPSVPTDHERDIPVYEDKLIQLAIDLNHLGFSVSQVVKLKNCGII